MSALGKAAPAESSRPSQPVPKDQVLIRAVSQEAEGQFFRLRGAALVETSEMRVRADEIDYDQESGYVEARGNVLFEHFDGGERLEADRVEYVIGDETGRFFNVKGAIPVQLGARPGILTSTSPFSFRGAWAERIKNRYVLHDGMLTNCKLPRPWWSLHSPRIDIVPGDRALGYRAVMKLRFVPIFYAPLLYKSLQERPRRSGFLTPNVGNSSRRGLMVGVGYYWAINRSYDATYRMQYFTTRGPAHHLELRAKPTRSWDTNFLIYGVNDRGLELSDGRRLKQGGYLLAGDARGRLPKGFQVFVDANYLSNFQFRQAFTESFTEAVFSEVHTIGYMTKSWSSYSLHFVAQRHENFQSTAEGDKILIRKLPQVEFRSADRELSRKILPLWYSFEASAGLVRRTQPLFQTRNILDRVDFAPRVTTALRWKNFHLIPSFGIRETHYGERQTPDGRIVGANLTRHARDFSLELVPPSLERVFNAPKWLGDKVKHVVEPRLHYRYVTGVADFNQIIRFDETELLSNTHEASISLINRLYAKKGGQVHEALSWELWQKRYFDPTFGGAVVAGRRNVVLSAAEMTGYTFLDGPRRYSPVVSVLRGVPKSGLGVEWRTDYDPLRGEIVNGSLSADVRLGQYSTSFGYSRVACVPLSHVSNALPCQDPSEKKLAPPANQLRSALAYGQENKRGWIAGFNSIYDFRTGVMQFATMQVTYNTDCCGFSVQYRRFGFGTRNENQFRVALSIANIGNFGTLKKTERMF
jgi:LPS-assembly protein